MPFLPPPDTGPGAGPQPAFGTDYDGGGSRPVVDPTYANDGNTVDTGRAYASFYNGGGTKTWWLEADLGSATRRGRNRLRGGCGNAGENDSAVGTSSIRPTA